MAKIKVKPIRTQELFDFKVEKDTSKIPPGCIAVLEGYATLSNDRTNKNKHFYPEGFWDSVLNNDPELQEKLDTKTFFGSFKHPGKDESPIPDFGNISHNIREFRVDKKGVYVVLDVFDTEQGRELKPLLDYGSKLGISTRAYGEVELDDSGYKVPVKGKYYFVTWDLVSLPAFSETRMDRVSDSVEIEIDDKLLKPTSKEDLMDKVKSLNKHDAQILCAYMGMDFDEISDSFDGQGSTDLEQALDQALGVIKKLEQENKELRKKTKVVVIDDSVKVSQEGRTAYEGLSDEEKEDLVSTINSENGIEVPVKVYGTVDELVTAIGEVTEEQIDLDALLPAQDNEDEGLEVTADSFEMLRLTSAVQYLKDKVSVLEGDKKVLEEGSSLLRRIVDDKTNVITQLETKIFNLNDALAELTKSKNVLQKINSKLEDKVAEKQVTPLHDSVTLSNEKRGKSGPTFRVHTGKSLGGSPQVTEEEESLRRVYKKLNN